MHARVAREYPIRIEGYVTQDVADQLEELDGSKSAFVREAVTEKLEQEVEAA